MKKPTDTTTQKELFINIVNKQCNSRQCKECPSYKVINFSSICKNLTPTIDTCNVLKEYLD